MAMRKMRVSFDLDIPIFLSMLATANSSMRIEILGDAKPIPAKLNGSPKQLAAPKKRRHNNHRVRRKGQPTIKTTLLAFLAKHKDRAVNTSELTPVIVAIGGKPNSVSPQLVELVKSGRAKHTGKGEYQITANGLKHVG